ncbi:putative damage-inducible protein DinB [Laceyella sacchari]|jgi:uncharacterized damage-inducible protein DinB|uniref:DinB family protein n=1 Tax=Laceyella sacchari TaxID=37482 RepID=UPI0010472EF6|nr:DinB family protein [Laceyella sacchari]TCW40757.1 putative damage-inducible protein DinB [Laceyella sacchari]
MNENTRQLYDYHTWANAKMFERLKELPADLYRREFETGFSSLSKVLAHMYAVDQIWFNIMSGGDMMAVLAMGETFQEQAEAAGMAELETMFVALSQQYRAFFERQGDLTQSIVLEHAHIGRMETPLYELVQHTVNHDTYHRGNIMTMLQQLGHPFTSMDYIYYLHAKATNG